MTLAEFEKLLDRAIAQGAPARQAVLDAYAKILKEDEELNAAIFPTMYKMQELQAQLSETRAEADALRETANQLMVAWKHAPDIPEAVEYALGKFEAALSAPPAEEPSR